MELALERIGSRVCIEPLHTFTRHPEAAVRKTVAGLLGCCRSDPPAAEQLARMTQDADSSVAATAARALIDVAGQGRFLQAAETMTDAALLEVMGDLAYIAGGRAILEGLLVGASEAVRTHGAKVLARWDDER